MKKNIAIIMGGYSSEYDISIKSGDVVYKTLSEDKDLNVHRIIINKEGWYFKDDSGDKSEVILNSFQVMSNGIQISFDLIFNTIHGIPGENGEIQKYFEKLGLKQTSSDSISAKLTFDKNACKEKVKLMGYNVPLSTIIKKGESYDYDMIFSKLRLPIFVKPNEGGSSFGISRIEEKKDLKEALELCFGEDDNALVEEEVQGREISVGVIKLDNKIIALPPTEIISHNSFFDYDAKYNGESDEITPAEINYDLEEIVKEISIDIYKKLNLNGFSRCDFILKDDKFYFLEVNTNPGLTEESILPQQAKAAGISLKKLFKSVIYNE